MKELGGRFFRPSPGAGLKMTAGGLSSDAIMIATKVDGRFLPNKNFTRAELRRKAEKIAKLLTEGRNAEAVFLANFGDWQSDVHGSFMQSVRKADYDVSEPRDERGRWSSGGDAIDFIDPEGLSADVVPIASVDDPRGNKMAKDAATAAGLNRAQRRRLHDLITGQGITDFQEILRIAKEIASGGA